MRLRAPKNESNWPVRLVAAIIFLNGITAIVDVLYVRLPNRLEMLVGIDYDLYGRLFGLFAGFILLYFSSQLLLRKRLAWWMAFIASAIVTLGSAVYTTDPTTLILPAVSLLVLAWYRDQFEVKVEWRSVSQGLRLLVLCIVIAVAYGSVGFARLAPRDFIPPHKVSLAEGAVRTLKEFALIGNNDVSPHSHRAHWFVISLDLLGSVSIAFAFYSLFRPLAYRYATLPAERDKARGLIERYGASSEDAFKLWPEDKAYFFNHTSSCVLAYRVDHGCALVLGLPVGQREDWPELITAFRKFCHRHDWVVAFIYVPASELGLFESLHLRPLKIGEDALVDSPTFATETIRSKHFRGVMNKFKRLGYEFEVTDAPQAPGLLTEAAAVTKAWLGESGRKERGFALGYHDRAYLRRSRLYSVRGDDGRLVAFANGITSYNQHEATIDLMRYRPGTETGVMDFLLASIILRLADDGVDRFSLGLAPLAGVGSGPDQSPEERILALGGRLGVGGFAFEGLRRFKDKFDPQWEARYLVYERGPAGLARTLLAINDLIGN